MIIQLIMVSLIVLFPGLVSRDEPIKLDPNTTIEIPMPEDGSSTLPPPEGYEQLPDPYGK